MTDVCNTAVYNGLQSAELVLSILLETFVFAPGSQEVYWAMGGLQSPVIKGSSDITPRLPLKVSFVNDFN